MKKFVILSMVGVVAVVLFIGYKAYTDWRIKTQMVNLINHSVPIPGDLETGPLEDAGPAGGALDNISNDDASPDGEVLDYASEHDESKFQVHESDYTWRDVAQTLSADEQLQEIDPNTLRYTNKKLRFSIEVPMEVDAYCSDKNGEVITRSPIGFYTYRKGHDSVVVLAEALTYIKDDNGYCTLQKNSAQNVQSRDGNGYLEYSTWHITVADIENRADLDRFANYQCGDEYVQCAVRSLSANISDWRGDDKEKSYPKETYFVNVGALPLDKEYDGPVCRCDYFLYDKVLKKAVQWDLGQAPTFMISSGERGYSPDMEMIRSFSFLRDN